MGLFSKLKKMKKKTLGGKIMSKTPLGKKLMGSNNKPKPAPGATKPMTTGGANKPAKKTIMTGGVNKPAVRKGTGAGVRARMAEIGGFGTRIRRGRRVTTSRP